MFERNFGFGLMRLPLKDTGDINAIDYEVLCKMVDQFITAGFTYFDTAMPYHNSNSEIAFRECVVKRYPRESFTITDKLTMFLIQKAEEIPGFFDAQLERCGVDYFDCYLLHALTKETYQQAEEMQAFEFISQKKAEGKVRHIGLSFHDKASVLDELLTKHPEMEYVQLQINYMDWDDPVVESRKCYEVCVKHNKPVIVMEPVKGGLLVNIPDSVQRLYREAAPELSAASWAIRYAASLDNVVMVLSGMSNLEQLNDNLSYMRDFKPLNERERAVIEQATEQIKARATISCTACRYCVEGCPQKIMIPDCFKIFNDVDKYGSGYLHSAKMAYSHLTSAAGKASSCIGCKKCEEHCPQHLAITAYLKAVASLLEE